MCAKPAKKNAKKSPPPTSPSAEPAPTAPLAPAGGPAADTTEAAPSWLESTDPRKRLLGKIVLTGVWIYVAALWLLALDQTFHWGIFGPKTPPVP